MNHGNLHLNMARRRRDTSAANGLLAHMQVDLLGHCHDPHFCQLGVVVPGLVGVAEKTTHLFIALLGSLGNRFAMRTTWKGSKPHTATHAPPLP